LVQVERGLGTDERPAVVVDRRRLPAETLLGHASIATTERYTAVDDTEVRATMMAAGAD
jgi:integrase